MSPKKPYNDFIQRLLPREGEALTALPVEGATRAPVIDHDFVHRHSAHCESGVTANLLANFGIPVSEPLIFGIASGIFFGYFPFIKVYGAPFITYRNAPGSILKKTAQRLHVRFETLRFKDEQKAMDALDRAIDEGVPVGLQTGVYWLPYMPDAMRFHFNAHSIVVYGRKEGDYLISDPVLDDPVVCPRKDLQKARFAKGLLAPRGKMFYLCGAPEEQVDMGRAISKGIRESCRLMCRTPFPLIGVQGARVFARSLKKWPQKYEKRRSSFYLAHAIRMQEEIGTGGGGFRLMYAAFLHEAAGITHDERFRELSKKMTTIGDRWREFALYGARICKNRSTDGENFDLLSEIILDCADREQQLFGDLWEIVR
jgi:hypothetical protein